MRKRLRCHNIISAQTFCFCMSLRNFEITAHLIALHCVSISIIPSPPIIIGMVVVIMFILTFLKFHRKLYIVLLISCIICLGGVSTYARYQILLSITWFIISFLPIIESLRLFHLFMSFSILVLTFCQFTSWISFWFCPYVYPSIFIFSEFHLKCKGFSWLSIFTPSHIPTHFFRLYLIPAKSSRSCSWVCRCLKELFSPI